MKEYCKNCGQLLNQGILARLAKEMPIEFEDGKYCLQCGIARIKNKRKDTQQSDENKTY